MTGPECQLSPDSLWVLWTVKVKAGPGQGMWRQEKWQVLAGLQRVQEAWFRRMGSIVI